eukprot:9502144-Pyramimonas_sp.AAC.2
MCIDRIEYQRFAEGPPPRSRQASGTHRALHIRHTPPGIRDAQGVTHSSHPARHPGRTGRYTFVTPRRHGAAAEDLHGGALINPNELEDCIHLCTLEPPSPVKDLSSASIGVQPTPSIL